MAEPRPDTRAAEQVRALREAGLLRGEMTFRQLAGLQLATLPVETLRTVRAMADALGVPKPAVTRAADALQAEGLLTRRINRFDRREIFLDATPRGRDRAAEILRALPACGRLPAGADHQPAEMGAAA